MLVHHNLLILRNATGKMFKTENPSFGRLSRIPSSYFYNKIWYHLLSVKMILPQSTSVLFKNTTSKTLIPSKKFRLGFRSPKLFEVQRRQKKRLETKKILKKNNRSPTFFKKQIWAIQSFWHLFATIFEDFRLQCKL